MAAYLTEDNEHVLGAPVSGILITVFWVDPLATGSSEAGCLDRDADAESKSASRRGVLRGGEEEDVLPVREIACPDGR